MLGYRQAVRWIASAVPDFAVTADDTAVRLVASSFDRAAGQVVADVLSAQRVDHSQPRPRPVFRSHSLSPREQQVLQGIGQGKTNRQIGDALGLSLFTIQTHSMRLRRKLGLESREELIKYAQRADNGHDDDLAHGRQAG